MAIGKKTGGRVKGTPNKDNPLKGFLRAHSTAYFEPSVTLDDEDIAKTIGLPVGSLVSRFDLDMALMSPSDRAAMHEKLLRYHTPQMQSVSAEVDLVNEEASIEIRLARLADTK